MEYLSKVVFRVCLSTCALCTTKHFSPYLNPSPMDRSFILNNYAYEVRRNGSGDHNFGNLLNL